MLDDLTEMYRQQLLRSDYRAGCPIVAVSVEAGDPDSPDRMAPVIERAAAAFARWTDLIAQRFVADGVTPERAEELAMLVTTSIEGAIVRRPRIAATSSRSISSTASCAPCWRPKRPERKSR